MSDPRAQEASASVMCSVEGYTATATLTASTSVGYDEMKRGEVFWGDGQSTVLAPPFTTAEHEYALAGTRTVVFYAYTDHGRFARSEANVTTSVDRLTPGGASLIHQASRTLTNAQIVALPTTPIEIVPATEILNYETAPTRLILPVSAIAIKPAGVQYASLDTDTHFLLAWGSDFSTVVAIALEMSNTLGASFLDSTLRGFSGAALLADEWQIPFSLIAPAPFGGAGYQDNGLYVSLQNAAGNLTGGDAANTLDVCCAFHVYDVPLKRYLTTQETGWDQETRTFA